MNALPPTRRGFTLTQLFVTIAIIAAFFGLLLPAVQRARESGRRARCTNNLRQLALGAHGYHDVHNRLPPICSERTTAAANDANYSAVVDGWGWSWIVLIIPYIESNSVYSQIDWRGQERVPYSGSNSYLVNRLRTLTLICPNRRARLQLISAGTLDLPNDDQWLSAAQPSDYSAVTVDPEFGLNAVLAEPATSRDEAPDPANPSKKVLMRSKTTLTSISPFTVMLGEKYMKQEWLGDMAYEAPAAVGHAFDPRGNVRYLGEPKAASSGKWTTGTLRDTFGGWHPKVNLFAMADASVQALSK